MEAQLVIASSHVHVSLNLFLCVYFQPPLDSPLFSIWLLWIAGNAVNQGLLDCRKKPSGTYWFLQWGKTWSERVKACSGNGPLSALTSVDPALCEGDESGMGSGKRLSGDSGFRPSNVPIAFLRGKLSNIISARSDRGLWSHKGLAVSASPHPGLITFASEEAPASEVPNYADAKGCTCRQQVFKSSICGKLLLFCRRLLRPWYVLCGTVELHLTLSKIISAGVHQKYSFFPLFEHIWNNWMHASRNMHARKYTD